MEIKFQGALTRQDYVNAFKLYWRSGKRFWLLMGFLIFILLLYSFLAYATGNWYLLIPGVIFVLFCGVMPYWNAWVNWKRFKHLSGPHIGSADLDWLRMSHPLMNQETRWELYRKSLANYRVLILLENAMMFRVIPRSFFSSDADWNAFVELVRSKVPAR